MKPTVLIILDGWGITKDGRGNAITLAQTPNIDNLVEKFPSSELLAFGTAVGLPSREDGNSEVGHLNLGAGRIVYQDLARIDLEIAEGTFNQKAGLIEALEHVKANNSKLHLLGMIGEGSVHSKQEHIYTLLEVAKENGLDPGQVIVHVFLDGRDSAPKSAQKALDKLAQELKHIGVGQIATITGRYYAMDRNRQWERTELTYNALVKGVGEKVDSPKEAIQQNYHAGVTDEFFKPTIITPTYVPISSKDSAIFINFRADRARQLTTAFVQDEFPHFERLKLTDLHFCTMTEYDSQLPVTCVLLKREDIRMSLPEVFSKEGIKQFHVAETEKYAHVTYFFNGGREEPFPGEDRLLVPSPKAETYDETPEMSAKIVTDEVIARLKDGIYEFVVANFANADMVGHTGNLEATVKAIEFLDTCLGKITEVVLGLGGLCVITADHGNAEEMIVGRFRGIDTKHSSNPVPLIIVDKELEGKKDLLRNGVLGDVAPTILYLLDIAQPFEMTGNVLIETK